MAGTACRSAKEAKTVLLPRVCMRLVCDRQVRKDGGRLGCSLKLRDLSKRETVVPPCPSISFSLSLSPWCFIAIEVRSGPISLRPAAGRSQERDACARRPPHCSCLCSEARSTQSLIVCETLFRIRSGAMASSQEPPLVTVQKLLRQEENCKFVS